MNMNKVEWKKFEAPSGTGTARPKLNTHYLVTDVHGQVGVGVFMGGAAWGTALCGANVIAWAELPEGYVETPNTKTQTPPGPEKAAKPSRGFASAEPEKP